MNRKTAFLICSTVLLSTNISILTRIYADDKQITHTNKIIDGSEESLMNETIESTQPNHSVICNQNGGTVTLDQNTLVKSGDSINTDGTNSIVYTTGSSFTKIELLNRRCIFKVRRAVKHVDVLTRVTSMVCNILNITT